MVNFPPPVVENFFQTFDIQTFAVSPDESQIVFSTNLNGTYNVWAMDLPHTFPYPLTFHNQSCHHLVYDRSGRVIFAVIDKDGDENGQIYAIPSQGGALKPIRKAEGARHDFPFLSEDGTCLYYTSTKDDPTHMKGYRYSLESEEEEVLLHGRDAITILLECSPSEKSFLYLKAFRNTYSLAYVRHEEEDILLTPKTDAPHTVSEAVYGTETDIYLLTNYESDFSYLAKFDIETGTFRKVAELEGNDFSQMTYDKATHSLYIVSQKGLQDRLFKFTISTEELTPMEAPVTIIDQLVVAGSGNMYILGDSATTPTNLFKYTEEEGWTPLTNYRVPGVKQEELTAPEYVTYPSFDGLPIEALLFRPKPENDNGHTIVWPHGGPQIAVRDSFRSLFSLLVHRGYRLFAPNFRGSAGYGLAFMKMVEGDWGNGPRLDHITGVDWLVEQGYAAHDKLLLMGGSYGGYMSLLLHGRHPEYFKACVDIFGPCNLFSFVDTVPEHWKPAMVKLIGDPLKDKKKLTQDSPIHYLDTMTRPMLVIQGANDPRVVKAESDQLVNALKDKGRDVDYIVLKDEGHGFTKKENEIFVYQKVLEFFDRYL